MKLQVRTPRQHGAKKPQAAKSAGLTKKAATAKKNAGKADVGKPSAGNGGGCGGNLDKPAAQGTLGATHGHLRGKQVANGAASGLSSNFATVCCDVQGKPAAKRTGEKPAAQGTASFKVGHYPHAAAMSAATAFGKKTASAAGNFAARGHAPSQAHAC